MGALIAVGVVVVAVEGVWLLAAGPAAALISDVGAIVVAGCAAAVCVITAGRHPPALRRFWLLLSATMALAATGRIIWTIGRIAGESLPHTPLIGFVFFAGIVTGTAALLNAVSAPRSAVGRARVVLDGVIVGLALIPVAWTVVYQDMIRAELDDPARSLGMLYPMVDLIQLAVLISVAGPARPLWPPMTLLGASLAVRAGADTVYVSMIAQAQYQPGHPLDVCWPLSYLLVALAGRYPPPVELDRTDETAEPAPMPWWRVALPYLTVGAAIVAIVAAGEPSPLIYGSGVTLLAALAVRQALAANENRRLAMRLRRLAYTDQLTGLPNRLLFTRRLRQAIVARGTVGQLAEPHDAGPGATGPGATESSATGSGAGSADRAGVAVLLLDLDGFKQVNDRFGHATGDAMLSEVATRMQAVVGQSGVVARLGGDEFAVLLDPAGDPRHLARRLLATLADDGVTSASIGIAEYGPQHAGDADLLRDADIAMYAAKAAGKAAYRICTPALREAAVTRAELIADLRRAVDDGDQFELAYQPIVEVGTGRVRGVEALVRWRHPRHGLLNPARFLPLAEETGLVLPLDRWVLATACRDAAGWQQLAPGVTVAVNLAPMHLRQPGLIGTVDSAVSSAGLQAAGLTLELTETALIDSADEVLARLAQLRELDVRISIDDFGTGYSSLSYLHRLPATDLKIDRSFVDRLDSQDPRAYATVEMVTRLAGAYGLVVVAEGVETDVQHGAIAAIGCPRAQGYRYGRPQPVNQLGKLITARSGGLG